jgi:hypothetical protein
MGSGLIGDASKYVTFSGHMAAPDPPMWWGQVLLLAQSSRPRLRRVMAWSHIQLFYHTTKNSHVGTVFLYSSKGYPSFRVPTNTISLGLAFNKSKSKSEFSDRDWTCCIDDRCLIVGVCSSHWF